MEHTVHSGVCVYVCVRVCYMSMLPFLGLNAGVKKDWGFGRAKMYAGLCVLLEEGIGD